MFCQCIFISVLVNYNNPELYRNRILGWCTIKYECFCPMKAMDQKHWKHLSCSFKSIQVFNMFTTIHVNFKNDMLATFNANKMYIRAAALTGHRTHSVSVSYPYTVIVRVFRLIRGGKSAATATHSIHTRLVNISQHMIMHQISALPC